MDISPLKRGFLLLNVVLENVDRCATATGSEVRRRPERAFPIASGQVGSFLSQHSAGYTLERVDQIGYSDLRRILDQQVDVVVFSVHLDKFSFKVGANVVNSIRSRLMESPSNTRYRYFVTKTKWTCIAKTQCLPVEMS